MIYVCVWAIYFRIFEKPHKFLLPRTFFGRHCNVSTAGHAKKLLTDTISLRNSFKKYVAGLGLSYCRVLDSCCVTDCTSTANIDSRLEALKTVTAQDSVHFLSPGYDNLICNILHTDTVVQGSSGNKPISSKSHLWRGFRSTVGAAATTPSNWPISRGRGNHDRGRSLRGGSHDQLFHPYQK